MTNTLGRGRGLLLCGSALASALAFTAPAHAQSAQDLRQQMQTMQQRLDALEASEAESKRAQQATAAQATAASQQAQAADLKGSFPGSIRIPGTDTSVRLYGFVRATGGYDIGNNYRGVTFAAKSASLTRSAADRQGGDAKFDARYSRLGFETRTDSAWGPVRSVVEFDFGGTQSTGSTTTQGGWTPRLRLAYVEAGPLLAGQTNTLFAGNVSHYELVDFNTAFGLSSVRQAQIRYTAQLGGGLSAAIGLEDPYSDYAYTGGTVYPDSDTSPAVAVNRLPDLTGSLSYGGNWGHVDLTGLLRQIRYTNDGAASGSARFHDSTTGYGVALDSEVNTIGKDTVFARAVFGDGIGRYLDSIGPVGAVSNVGMSGVNAASVRLDTVQVVSGMMGFQHFWAPTVRSTLLGGLARISYPDYVRQFSTAMNRTMGEVQGNLIWSPIKALDLGMEYHYGERSLLEENSDGAKRGAGQRVMALVKYSF